MRRSLILVVLALLALPSAANAGTLSVQSGVMSYTETDVNARNVVAIGLSSDGTRITVSDSGRSGGRALTLRTDGSCTVSRATGSCPAAGVSSIDVNTGELDDTISNNTSMTARLDGGNGNDKITGGPGNDVLIGEAGSDTLAGGGGRDTADYSARIGGVFVTLDGTANDGEAGENDNVAQDVEILAGGSGNDTLVGSNADNALLGNAGNDTLAGGDGSDQLDGGAGDDSLDGGDGADTLTGGDGTDTASYAHASTGVRVVLDGKAGDGAPGENDNVDTENVIGGAGDDTIIGNGAPNALAGGAGNDRILAGQGADLVDGGPGDDIIQTLDGENDVVACGDGEDGVVTDRSDTRTDCDYIKYRPVGASATALHISNGAVRAPVRCSPATAEGCRGRMSLRAGRTTLGTLTYRLASGRRWVAKIKLTRKGRAYVSKHRVTTASLIVRDVDATGDANRTTQTIRIGR